MDKRVEAKFNKLGQGANALLNALMILYTALCLMPILLVISVSFTDEKQILAHGYSFFPQVFSLKSYGYLFAMRDIIWRSYGISIFVTILGTIASLSVITLYAYPISRRDFKYRNHMSFVVFFTMIFGGGLVPWYMVYLHLIPIKETIWILIVPYLMNGWYVLIMRTFFKTTVPDELLEAAKLDGAGEFRTFFSIVLPISKAGLATIGLFCMLQYWNDWYLPLVFITNSKLYNIQYVLYQTLGNIQWLGQNSSYISGQTSDFIKNFPSEGARMAIAVLSIGPIIFAYPFFQRYFIQGLTIGAVKG
jgi:putative aldouronate transport system permease protein